MRFTEMELLPRGERQTEATTKSSRISSDHSNEVAEHPTKKQTHSAISNQKEKASAYKKPQLTNKQHPVPRYTGCQMRH